MTSRRLRFSGLISPARFALSALEVLPILAGLAITAAACSADDAHVAEAPDASAADAARAPDAARTGDAGEDARVDAPNDAGHDAADAEEHDAAPPYSPCPPQGTPCAIMPLGDSITWGSGSSGGGYRVELFHQANSHHKSITFVGSDANGPTTVDNVPFPRADEGHPGFTIDDGGGRSGIQPFIAATLQAKKPNVVTLMIGTNDVDISLDLANAPKRLAKLVDTILASDPSLLLVIAQIVPTRTDAENTRVQAYNAAIPAIVSARASAGKHVAMVDMYSAFTANADYKTKLFTDNLHPNDAGYVVMGDVWYAALGPYLR